MRYEKIVATGGKHRFSEKVAFEAYENVVNLLKEETWFRHKTFPDAIHFFHEYCEKNCEGLYELARQRRMLRALYKRFPDIKPLKEKIAGSEPEELAAKKPGAFFFAFHATPEPTHQRPPTLEILNADNQKEQRDVLRDYFLQFGFSLDKSTQQGHFLVKRSSGKGCFEVHILCAHIPNKLQVKNRITFELIISKERVKVPEYFTRLNTMGDELPEALLWAGLSRCFLEDKTHPTFERDLHFYTDSALIAIGAIRHMPVSDTTELLEKARRRIS